MAEDQDGAAPTDGGSPRDPRTRMADGAVEALEREGRVVVAVDRLHGGTIASTYRITLDDQTTVVLKQSRRAPDDAWAIEADGLDGLRVAGGPDVPEVIAFGDDFLVIEDFGHDIPETDEFWSAFGRRLATLHGVTGERFGWHRENLLGLVTQDNSWNDDGWDFFGQQRLVRYLALENVERALSPQDRADLERVAGRLTELVPPQPPSLVHGDLWRSNVLATAADRPALCDPAVAYAWAELDVSMLWCSGGVPDSCFDAYNEVRPLDGDWKARMPLLHVRENLSVLAHIGPDEGTVKLIRDALRPFL